MINVNDTYQGIPQVNMNNQRLCHSPLISAETVTIHGVKEFVSWIQTFAQIFFFFFCSLKKIHLSNIHIMYLY